ncbi:hypothetical protein F5Y04DRAFT_166353 [Hypomontagnella monticulosa]|nr:hypothetical protein F5Y04DRAFT_166353 [Hypomontagnella monticulosa]
MVPLPRPAEKAHRPASMSSIPMSLPLSFEQENEVLAKARKRNRLAQRKHRQKMKSISSTSGGKSSDGQETTQRPSHVLSRGDDLHNNYDYTSGEDFPSGRRNTRDIDGDHGCYTLSPNANTQRDSSLQTVDLTSISPDLWSFSKDMDALMNPDVPSGPSSLDPNEKARRPSVDGGMTAFNNSLLPMETSRPDAQLSQTGLSGYGIASQASFGNVGSPLSPEISHISPNQLGKRTQSFSGAHRGQTKNRRDSAISHFSTSPRSNESTASHWSSNVISPSQPNTPGPGSTFSPQPLYVVVPSPGSGSNPLVAGTNQFQGYLIQSTAPRPSSSLAESARRSPKEDELSRLEKVLEAIDEAGFDSLDSMIAAYYTSEFPHGTPIHSAQALSKKRHLRRLLAALHESAKNWDAQESQNFREGIMRNAEDILVDEMQSLDLENLKGPGNDKTLGKLESALISRESYEATKENKRIFKQRATETWSLLTELGHAVGIQPAQNAQIVSTFLSMLVNKQYN